MIIFHGENQVESRRQLTQALRGKQTVDYGSDISLDQLVSAVGSNSLFGGPNTIVLENVLSGRPSSERKAVINYLIGHQDRDIVVWEGKDVSAKLKDFDPRLGQRFDLPKYIFAFLDHPTVSSLHQVLETMPAEQVLASLATRAHKRANTAWIKELLEIDYGQKTSSAPYDLATALELWVVKNVRGRGRFPVPQHLRVAKGFEQPGKSK